MLLSPTALAAIAPLFPAFAQPSFAPLGFLDTAVPSPASEPADISGDGLVIVGTSALGSTSRAFRWTSSVMTPLPTLSGVGRSAAYAANVDGSVIVGEASNATGTVEAVRWLNGSVQSLNAGPNSYASAISHNGLIAFGSRPGLGGTVVFRWSGGSVLDLGELGGGTVDAITSRCSADGSFLVGQSDSTQGYEAFRWSGGSFLALGDLPGGAFSSDARDVSDDGSIVVGIGNPGGGAMAHAARWAAGASPVDLGRLPGGLNISAALGCSADGRTIVGYSGAPEGLRAVVWTPAEGIRRVDSILASLGVAVPHGWQLTRAVAVSDDGLVIAGVGIDPQGRTQGWVASLRTGSGGCPADLDDDGDAANGYHPDGGVDVNDLIAFLSGFEAGDVAVDLDDDGDPSVGTPDGGVDVNDLVFFLARFEGGC